jgi:signal transduction histidine kinase
VLAHILQCFLQDAQDDRLLGPGQAIGRGRQVGADREAGQGRRPADRVRDRPVEAELVEDRRAELADERPDRPELTPKEVAQEAELRPPVLDELGLDGAITDAIGRLTALTGLEIEAELAAPAERLTGTQQTVVLRVLQEALQNVRKHGAASPVTVASAVDGGEWVLTVRDDGRGFDVGAVAARGRRNFGLQFMRERAELIGARFEVHSRPDGGTLVRLAIPLGAEETS